MSATLALLAGCGSERASAPAKDKPHQKAATAATAPQRGPAPSMQPPPNTGGADAASVLRRYYEFIEAGRYGDAYQLREPGGADAAAFAAHFQQFGSQKTTVGAPSVPIAGGDWIYVEVPVQTYGSMKDGTPFGSAGTVTLRRRVPSGSWRIYAK